jgi:two-component system, OmpR family, KDP operon response regulator KdpE
VSIAHEFELAASRRNWHIHMKTPKALLLYQETNGSEPVRKLLEGEGCLVDQIPLDSQTDAHIDFCVVVFDIPRLTARLLEVLRAWRDEAPDTVLLVIGSRAAPATRIAVLETGADAYFTKPVAVAELRARVRAALRRFRSHNASIRRFPFGSAIIDLEARMILGTGRDARLTPTECGILEHLALHMNQTVHSAELVRTLWGDDPQKGVHSLRLFIRKLRNKLEPDPAHPRYLVTEPAVGYRLQTGPESLSSKSVNS